MQKIIFLFCALSLFACNNESSTNTNKDTATKSTAANVTLNTDALSFLSPCVDSTKTHFNLSEQEAYSFCKCLYSQVQQKHPNEDSLTLLNHLSDTAEVAQMAANCK